jgi:signal transduction histidine kinase
MVVGPAFPDSTIDLLSKTQRITHFRYIQDSDKNLNRQFAVMRFKQGRYQTLSAEAFNIGNSDDVFWILVTVLNDSAQDDSRRLVFGAPFVPLLNAYLLAESGNARILIKHNGQQKFSQRINDKIKLNSIEFVLPARQAVEILIQYQPRGMSFLPISLETDEIFSNKEHSESIQAAIFFSFSLTVILLFFFFGIAMRSNIVLFYVLLFLEYMFFLAIIEGYAFKYFWPQWPQWNMISGLVAALVFSASGFFMSSVVVEKTVIDKEFKIFCRVMAVLSLLMLLLIPVSENVIMMMINQVMMLIMLISQGYCVYSWLTLSVRRNILAFYTALILTGVAFYIFTLLLDSSSLSEWMVVSFNRSIYLFVSLTTMGTFAIHLGGLRNDHAKSLQRELEIAQHDAELNRALFESEQRYSQARELASKRQQQLAAASHDIRQPLMSLRSTIDSILKEQNSTVRKQLHDAFHYIDQLCSQYLAETRPQSASEENSEYYSVLMITDSVAKMFQQEAVDKGLQFHVVPCSVEISCPPMVLIRILSNFVANAIKHSDHGKIVIGCRRLPGYLRIDVYDNGPGISPQQLKTILEPYHKGDKSEGEGLGLSIVKEIADSKGWGVTVESSLGKGSRFSITVPAPGAIVN